MELTSSEIYWIMQADSIRNACAFVAALSVVVAFIGIFRELWIYSATIQTRLWHRKVYP